MPKPRSDNFESRDGLKLPSYRGDIVNRPDFTENDRTPDPMLMLRGYERAALTLNFIRALIEGGFADLHHPEYWDLRFVEHSPFAAEYQKMVEIIGEGLAFMETITDRMIDEIHRVDFFASHEGLLLHYEQAQTKQVPHRSGWYNLSTHLPWIGMRTADPDGAHVEYFRGINNPLGIKIGPGMTGDWLNALLDRLNPNNEPGRIVLIHRMGVDHIADQLPALIESVARRDAVVCWCCDPMHGNTIKTDEGVKTRRFEDILSELETAFDIHSDLGTNLGGVHFELSGDNITECIGGARGLSAADLGRAYRSQVDPRLNYEQSLEMAMLVARRMRA